MSRIRLLRSVGLSRFARFLATFRPCITATKTISFTTARRLSRQTGTPGHLPKGTILNTRLLPALTVLGLLAIFPATALAGCSVSPTSSDFNDDGDPHR